MQKAMGKNPYVMLAVMAALSFLSMYVLMYAMVDTFANVLPNFNQLYMAGLMTAPMVVIELLLMRSMYPQRTLNTVILAWTALAFIAFWLLIRQQIGISNVQFLKSMIPHHGAAILMCEQAPITDGDIKKLCRTIITSQRSEIDQMKAILKTLDRP